MDENPYKAPTEEDPNAPEPTPAKRSGFLDPRRNAIALLILGAIMTWAIASSMIWAG